MADQLQAEGDHLLAGDALADVRVGELRELPVERGDEVREGAADLRARLGPVAVLGGGNRADDFEGKPSTKKYLCKLDGDTLTTTYHMMNPGERPATLESTPGSFLWTVVYKLRKAAPPTKPAPAAKAAAHKPRTWKSTAGTTIEATFVELDGDVVVLEKKNGDEVRVPLEKLSAMDRKWVKDAGKK